MAQYDGEIRINTRIISKGLSDGLKNISLFAQGAAIGVANVAAQTRRVPSVMDKITRSVKAAGLALGVAFSIRGIRNFLISLISQFDLSVSSIGANVQQLNTAMSGLKSAFVGFLAQAVAPLIPYIITFVNWLAQLFSIAARLFALIFGLSSGMSALASSSNSAAGGAGKLAENTKRAAKEANNALASFDELNVLQDESAKNADAADAGAGGSVGAIVPEMAKISDEMEARLQAIAARLRDLFEPARESFLRLVEALKPLGSTLWDGLKWAWENILKPLGQWAIDTVLPTVFDLLAQAAETLDTAFKAAAPELKRFFEDFLKPIGQFVGDAFIAFLNMLTNRLADLSEWIKENPEKFRGFVKILEIAAVVVGVVAAALFLILNPMWLVVAAVVAIIAIIANWGAIMDWIKLVIRTVGKDIRETFDNMTAGIRLKIDELQGRFVGFANSVYAGMMDKFNSLKIGILGVFDGIAGGVKGAINRIIDAINGMLKGAVSGLNSLITTLNNIGKALPGYKSIGLVSAPQIPRLARGAVIPPNSEFVAVLGDQKSGRNIEMPENLLRQIVREESGGQASGEIIIKFEGSLSALIRELKPYIDKENVRVGKTLIASSVVT